MPAFKKRKVSHGKKDLPADQKKAQDEAKVKTPKTFKELGVIPQLCKACDALGYKAPTAIQADSRKITAFALPILQALMDKPQPLLGLVLTSTREPAYQSSEVFEALDSKVSVRTVVLVEGLDMVPQSIAIGKRPHMVIATPGRLLDHFENTKSFSLRTLKYLVMGEADRLLNMDFGPIINETPKRASLNNPLRVSVSSDKYQTVATLLQYYQFIPHKHKDLYLIWLLNEHVEQSSSGFGAIALHGQLSQSARLGALGKFRVASRGLDMPYIDLVLCYDLSDDSKIHVHRIRRTARAGKSGKAVSFVTQYDVEVWLRVEKALDKKLPEYKVEKKEVQILSDRVSEAQRQAITELKDMDKKKGGKGSSLTARKPRYGGKRGRDHMDQEEG
ncbi:P-loop containing nucleoside triphosphate hydrolase protein [Talaromyces proteolyticus]|uniref:RNA helicase n=1 Tax=Talaromyces proteolyticus TaxID=1131652 RepID=A0AAD4PWR6_9EURO|nr:P-loop containing nucleoside triphosphate hydrolase protein [Talaromyces proteolyticus]KAH8695395.1 P-loop containing nucleoside triphosphate hydrolase protein [Talaromyces proteolyticus]